MTEETSWKESVETGVVKVLIVDDDVLLANALERLLRRYGFHADVALDGATAIEKIGAAEYDVMLLDLRMESMGGLEVFEAVRSSKAPPSTILHSAFLDIRTAVIATRSGVCEVLEKPVPEEVLIERIREAAAAHRSSARVQSDPDELLGPDSLGGSGASGVRSRPSLPDLERQLILRAFVGSGQNLSRAARELGIPRSTLRDRLRRYGVR